MTDEEIRAALLEARGSMVPLSVPDHVVVLRDRVAGDPDEIDRWVCDHGGRIHTEPGYESQQLGGGPWGRRRKPPSRWYVVPASALEL